MSLIYNEKLPITEKEKIVFLKKHHIALWDVIKSCTIKGSSDSSIKDVEVNNINKIIKNSEITKIYTTGKTAYNLYNKYLLSKTNITAIYLPSTSAANASISIDKLAAIYKQINPDS